MAPLGQLRLPGHRLPRNPVDSPAADRASEFSDPSRPIRTPERCNHNWVRAHHSARLAFIRGEFSYVRLGAMSNPAIARASGDTRPVHSDYRTRFKKSRTVRAVESEQLEDSDERQIEEGQCHGPVSA